MRIRCSGCGRTINVPAERANNPRLKVKCTCTAVFILADAVRVEDVPVELPPLVLVAEPEPVAVAAAPAPMPASAPARPLPPGTASTGIRLKPLDADLPAPPPPPRPTPTPAASRPAVAARPQTPPRPASAVSRPAAGPDWRRCLNHTDRSSDHVCTNCQTGYCGGCLQEIRGAGICPACDSLCVRTNKYLADREMETQRGRSLVSEIPTILAYPFRDPLAYVLLALFTGAFAFAARYAMFGGGVGFLLSQGVLMAYCFYALSRVADGNMKEFMPDLTDPWDLVPPLKLGFAAFLATTVPFILVAILGPGLAIMRLINSAGSAPETPAVYAAQPPAGEGLEEILSDEGADEAVTEPVPEELPQAPQALLAALSPGILLLIAMTLLWKLVYTPVALTVAALSRSFLSTINPIIGVSTILRMGSIYWQAMAIYIVISLVTGIVSFIVGLIPLAGVFLNAFVNAYAFLAIGCTMGLAVFKKAHELGFD